MVNQVYFLLPVDRTIASSFVRALCLKDVAPYGWKFSYIDGPNLFSKGRLSAKYNLYLYYFEILRNLSRQDSSAYLYFIKPSSSFIIFVARFIFRLKIFVDINDAIHLSIHLGRLSKPRSWLFLNLAHGIVFESEEYQAFLGQRYINKSVVIEDTPQFSQIYERNKKRHKRVIWYGSSGTSFVLMEYLKYLSLFNENGYSILLLGADERLFDSLKSEGLIVKNVPSYGHKDLVAMASESLISFVPMPDTENFNLRGNLKAKFGMACGCITIASNIKMHQRLIVNGSTGYLFDDLNSVRNILEQINAGVDAPFSVARRGNEYVANEFTVEKHAKKLTEFFLTV